MRGDDLAYRYRVSAVEIDLLELLDVTVAGSIFSAVLDFDGYLRLAKNLVSRSESETASADLVFG